MATQTCVVVVEMFVMAETKPSATANVKAEMVVSQCGYCRKPIIAQGKDSASGMFQMQGSLSREVSKGAQATIVFCVTTCIS